MFKINYTIAFHGISVTVKNFDLCEIDKLEALSRPMCLIDNMPFCERAEPEVN